MKWPLSGAIWYVIFSHTITTISTHGNKQTNAKAKALSPTTTHTLIPTHSHIAKIVFHFRVEVSCCLLLGFWFGCEMQSKYVTTHKAETAIAAVAGTTTTTATTTGNLHILLSQKTLFFLSSCWGLSIKISCSGGCCCLSLAMTRASLWRVCVRVLEMSKRWKVNIGHEYWSICVGYANFFGRPFSTLLSIIMNFGSCLRHRYFFLCKLIYYEFIDLSWI